jgi:hypothetical protein
MVRSNRLTVILDSGVTFQIQVDLIKVLRARSSEENVTKWCGERMSLILASLNKLNPTADDVPALLSVVVDRGLPVLSDVLVHLFRSISVVPLPLLLVFSRNLDRKPVQILHLIFGLRSSVVSTTRKF